jgi:UPF0271 protein
VAARTIDLNADVGEAFGSWTMGDDEALLGVVSSANVACGFHAGDAVTARAVCGTAAAGGVVVGAHVGYRDLAGFGRRFLDVRPSHLTDEVVYQIGALAALAAVAGTSVRYVKPHGALYNAIVHHDGQARAVVDALRAIGGDLALVVLPGSHVEKVAETAGVRTVAEAFADRAYSADGTLVPRGEPGAVLHDPAEIARRVVRLVEDGTVTAHDGTAVPVRAQSICVHGDAPGAVSIARGVRAALDAAGVTVASPL